jgi:hypothetical protein
MVQTAIKKAEWNPNEETRERFGIGNQYTCFITSA